MSIWMIVVLLVVVVALLAICVMAGLITFEVKRSHQREVTGSGLSAEHKESPD